MVTIKLWCYGINLVTGVEEEDKKSKKEEGKEEEEEV